MGATEEMEGSSLWAPVLTTTTAPKSKAARKAPETDHAAVAARSLDGAVAWHAPPKHLSGKEQGLEEAQHGPAEAANAHYAAQRLVAGTEYRHRQAKQRSGVGCPQACVAVGEAWNIPREHQGGSVKKQALRDDEGSNAM